jgi:hypothetical protein
MHRKLLCLRYIYLFNSDYRIKKNRIQRNIILMLIITKNNNLEQILERCDNICATV